MISKVMLREVFDEDLEILFHQQKDPYATKMAAFISRNPSDKDAFDLHWSKIRKNEEIIIRTILCENNIAGNIVSFMMDEKREVGYWLGKEFWGKGIATAALSKFVDLIKTRPLFAHVAFDNNGSIKVLEKCGFIKFCEDYYFAKARGKEIKEFIYHLK